MSNSTQRPKRLRIGDGYISGYLSILFAAVTFGAMVCLRYPEYVTTAEFRVIYPPNFFRWILIVCFVFAFCFAFSSFMLSRKSKLGLIGIAIGAVAVFFGGPSIETTQVDQSIANLSLDWLLIDIIVLSVIFIPIELFLPKRLKQTRFHLEWKTDAIYFVISHLIVQYTAIAVKFPAEAIFGQFGLDAIQDFVVNLPFIVQLVLAMFMADLFQYWAHRLFHRSRILWRFHAVHHSISTVDWVAGSRLHIVDILLTRAFSYMPLYFLGLSVEVFYTYVVIVAFQATIAHANTRIPFGPLKYLLVTPQYHHWHHSDDPAHYDQNFAIHFPVIDRIFGTYYLPGDKWPASMSLSDQPFPKGYLKQLVHPFRTH
jgi:sterol desaturase/sphingolipid hydroxylase (fatty acid hydroxylase superfamily)